MRRGIKKVVNGIIVRFLIIALFAQGVVAADAPSQGIFLIEQATTWDKILCAVNIRDCAQSNIGMIVLKEGKQVKLAEQSVVAAGIRLEGQEVSFGGYNDRSVPKDTLAGFCASVQLEKFAGHACDEYTQASVLYTIDGQVETYTVKKGYRNGDIDRICVVKTLSKAPYTYTYTHASARAICADGGSTLQGDRDFSFRMTTIAPERTCTPEWVCSGTNMIKYVRADCTADSDRTCQNSRDGNWICQEVPNGDDTCKEIPKPVESPSAPPSSGFSNNGQCERDKGETCDDTDCAGEADCKPLDHKDTKECARDVDCQQGWTCTVALGLCIPPPVACAEDADCKDGFSCVKDKNICEATPGKEGVFTNDEAAVLWASGILLMLIGIIGIVYWTRFRGR